MHLNEDEMYTLIKFIKEHDRNEIPEDVWEIYVKMYDELDED